MKTLTKTKLAGCLLMAAIALQTPVYAANLDVHYENHYVEDNRLNILWNDAGSDVGPTKSDTEVTLGGEALPIVSALTVRARQIPVSYMLIADVSGSMSEEKIKNLKDILHGLVAAAGENDNIAIMKVANGAETTVFLSDKTALNGVIDGISAKTGEDTNLYKGIVTAIKTLDSDTTGHYKRCVVIVSDGKDEFNAAGYTLAEAEKAVEDSNIPVYTIAMPGNDTEAAKSFGRLSRISAGGVEQVLANDLTTEAAAKNVNRRVNGGYAIACDLTDADLSRDQMSLEIKIESGALTASAGVTVDTAAIRDALGATPPEGPDDPAQDQEGEAQDAETGGNAGIAGLDENMWLFAGIVAAVLVIVVIALVLLLKRRGKKQADAKQPERSFAPGGAGAADIGKTVGVTVATPQPADGNGKFRFVFTELGGNGKQYGFNKQDELTIGRAASNTFALPDDTHLSSKHCRIYRSGENFYVEDLNSTNGTYINGVKILRPTLLEQVSVLLVGSKELRVRWESR
jgi:uncharacterized protein YegL